MRRFVRLRTVALLAAWLSVWAASVIWARDGGVAAVAGGPALALGSLGRLAALLAADLLLVQMLLMARIPALEQGFGRPQLIALHRGIGAASVLLLLTHIALTVVATGLRTGDTALVSGATLITHGRPMMAAVVAALLLIAVAVTSSRRASAGSLTAVWRLVHLNAYAGVLLALPHQLVHGSAFHTSWVATVYWVAIYLLTFGVVATYRVVLPIKRSLGTQLSVDRVVPEGPGTVSVHLKGRDVSRLRPRAGQFFAWRFLDGSIWPPAKHYALSAAPTEQGLRITVRTTGPASRRLLNLKRGTWAFADGPYGHLTDEVRVARKLAFFAAGICIAPVRALLEELDYGRSEASVIYRVHDPGDVLFADELDALVRSRGVEMVVMAGERRIDRPSWLPQSAGSLGDSQAVTRLIPDVTSRDVYVCGPRGWVDQVEKALLEAGVPSRQIHSESFTW